MVVTEELKGQVIRLHESRKSPSLIAKATGLHKVQVDRLIRKARRQRNAARQLLRLEVQAISVIKNSYHPGESALKKLDDLEADAQAIFDRAISGHTPKYHVAIKVIQTQAELLSVKVRLMATIKDLSHEDIRLHPEFIQIRNLILRTLETFPDARSALIEQLNGLKLVD
jgi:hypothetical protein